MDPIRRPLLDVLGARWRVGVAVLGVAWAGRPAFAGFALGDGSLALAPATWEGGPVVRPREGHGAELVPATAAAPPVARIPVHQGACLGVAADPDAGFLTAGMDGQVARVLADAEIRVLARLNGPVTSVASGPGGWRVCAAGRSVHRLGASALAIEVGGDVTALALDLSGVRLAIGYEGGVTVWSGGDAPRVLHAVGVPRALAWAADGTWLAAAGGTTLQAWHWPNSERVVLQVDGSVSTLTHSGSGFAAGAGGRIILWHPAPRNQVSQPCGIPNQSPVTRIAGHPGRTVIAAGYGNGTVVLCQPNDPALLFIRAAGEGAVSALEFSQAGDHLAIGTEGGEIAVLALPDVMFRDNPRSQ